MWLGKMSAVFMRKERMRERERERDDQKGTLAYERREEGIGRRVGSQYWNSSLAISITCLSFSSPLAPLQKVPHSQMQFPTKAWKKRDRIARGRTHSCRLSPSDRTRSDVDPLVLSVNLFSRVYSDESSIDPLFINLRENISNSASDFYQCTSMITIT